MPTARVVAITGASAGLGRAIAARFARAGDKVGLIARDEGPLQGLRKEIAAAGGVAAYAVADVSDADAVMAAAASLESALGTDRYLDQRCDGHGFCVARGDHAGGIPPRHRRHLSRPGPRHDGGAQAHAPARPGPDHPDRIGPRLSRHSPAIGLLRRQARDTRLHRCAARGIDPWPIADRRVDRGNAGNEYPAIRLGAGSPSPGNPSRPAGRSINPRRVPRPCFARPAPGRGSIGSAPPRS